MLPLVIACLTGVFCLAPLAVYLSWLASVNRRPRPTVLDARWDFAALLGGLSGFLLFGGGVLVAALQSNARIAGRGNWEQIREAWGQEQVVWGLIAGGYLLAVAVAATVALLSRRQSVTVYNIEREVIEAAVDDALAAVGQPAQRLGNEWAAGGRAVVRIEPLPGLRNMTVRFVTADPQLAAELDRDLRRRLADAPGADSAAAGWLVAVAVGLLVAVTLSLLLLAYLVYLTR